MDHEDFDVDSLARYLHLTPPQVQRMADRGKLPGRRIGGEWRFSRAEIHHWMEDRMGVGGEVELAEVQDVLDASHPAPEDFSLRSLLPPGGIAFPLQARTRTSVIAKMVELAAETGRLWDADKMAEAVRSRENLHSTALDNGVALLHPRRPMSSILEQSLITLGRTYQGIPFGGGQLTDIFFLICSKSDRAHLHLLSRLSRLISDPAFLEGLRQATSEEAMRRVLAEFEEQLP